MSAQNNFDARQAVRTTWGNLATKYKLPYYFLVGRIVCEIPLEDRMDEYTCQDWPMSLDGSVSERTELSTGSLDCQGNHPVVPLYQGFSFIVQHSIVVKRLGVLSTIVTHLGEVRVSLLDSATGQRITSATFTATDEEVPVSSVILTRPVKAYLLPKGFEGQVLVEMNEWPVMNISCHFQWMNLNGVIRFLQLMRRKEERPCQFTNNSFTPVTMLYTIHDIRALKNHVAAKFNRSTAWRRESQILKSKLIEESQEKGDILFLDVVDVYRNLPEKLLLFLQWAYLNKKFSYFLKTDDDTFVDVSSVVRELHQVQDKCKFWWWSSYREGWPIQTAGKWREDHYRSLTYPPFPCGAGYVLSYDTVQFLATNGEDLYSSFQGEDVSVGIWLAGLNPCRHSGSDSSCVWSCDEQNSEIACNRAQLSTRDMLRVWEHHPKDNR
ncbi:UDP-GalNAc:beta-1,3-N-acetylgalactosaminyltransferase 2 isoform X2 [Anabrus simplex]